MAEHLFIKTCFREPVERTPVWLMRQAGRYMPEYQRLRRDYSFMEMCKRPEIASKVTLQPIEALGVDAAILFSDILFVVEAMGVEVEFSPQGPRLEAIRTDEDIAGLEVPEVDESLQFVMETVKMVKEKLGGRLPLIGFSGAPFTLASYMIEGGGSKDFRHTKERMFSRPESFDLLMEKLSETVTSYLNAQIKAGADAVQLFDTWAGCLAPEDYEKHVLRYTSRIISSLNGRGEVPAIHFVDHGATFLELVGRAGGEVVGIDWRTPLREARSRIGYSKAIQGNLDPMVLFAPRREIEARVKSILEQGGREGHIFNLGHGVHKHTSVEKVKLMVDSVKKFSRR